MRNIVIFCCLALTLGACADGRTAAIVGAGVVGAVVGAELVTHYHRHRHCYYRHGDDRWVCRHYW